LQIRVGGRFIYPPPDLSAEEVREIKRILFVAGGVGINPIMSMLEHLHLESHLMPGRMPSQRLLYGTRAKSGEAILFYERIARMLQDQRRESRRAYESNSGAKLYLTGSAYWAPNEVSGYEKLNNDLIQHNYGRIKPADVLDALGPRAGRKNTVAYVCGPPKMIDELWRNSVRQME
jgi:NAD(P)H-flavin reductase